MSEVRVIKKYPNRRLYDTEQSHYITLADVRKLVREGVAFKVVDSQSGKDITRSILIQIITEQESGPEALFTTDMLADVVRFYDKAVRNVFSSYLSQSMQLFAEQQEFVREQMNEALGGKSAKAWVELAERNMELWREMQDSFWQAAGLRGRGPGKKK